MSAPRLVVVYRRTQLDELLAERSTLPAVEFFLESRGQSVEPLLAADEAQRRALDIVTCATPHDWRQAMVERADLPRFLFEPDDLIVVVGQDGLVPNVGKYLQSQAVYGISPGEPGVLCRHEARDLERLLRGKTPVRERKRSMVEAVVDDGQALTALNEVFIGDRGHQSARYVLSVGGGEEHQSSSGVIVGTGTGTTGWLASLWRQNRPSFALPRAESSELVFFVREPWPSHSTGTTLSAGLLEVGEELVLRAQSSLVVFGDGIERDRLRVEWGQQIRIRRAARELTLLHTR